jgi:RNA polymerase sigma factor (sigma-70 family)
MGVNRRRLTDTGLGVRSRFAGDDRLTAAIRRGDRRAFEVVYDRYSSELLRFGVHMLGSQHDAEDAVQATFAAAYRALLADDRPVSLRPWLFTIARNECVSILRARRQTVGLGGELALTDDPVQLLEVGEEVRQMLVAIRELPEQQRAALVLAEAHGLTHAEIAAVLGTRTKQVKAFVYQARANLLADRGAREAVCEEIRGELTEAHGPLLLRGRLRRHLRCCVGCREYAANQARQRRHLRAALPFLPSVVLKRKAMEGALGLRPGGCAGADAAGASVAGLAEVAGGVNALVAKVLAGALALSAGVGVGASIVGVAHPMPGAPPSGAVRAASATTRLAVRLRPRLQRAPADPTPSSRRERRRITPAAARTFTAPARTVLAPHQQDAFAGLRQDATPNSAKSASTARPSSGPQSPQGESKGTEAARRERAREREAARERRVGEHEQHQGKHEEHPTPAAKSEPHGPVGKHPEGLAKGPPTAEEQQQKHEAQERQSEEHEPEHGPSKAAPK